MVDEVVPGKAAVFEDVGVGAEDAVGEPVVADELPDILDRIELGAFWRQRNNSDICGHDEAGRQVPASLIDQEDGMGSGRDRFGDLRKMEVHCLAVASRQDQGRALALLGADRSEDVGGSGPLVARRARASATLRPAAGNFVLLADAGLIGEPNFYRVAVDALRARDRFQTLGEVFFFSIAPSACAW
jgi:hypothetical protein